MFRRLAVSGLLEVGVVEQVEVEEVEEAADQQVDLVEREVLARFLVTIQCWLDIRQEMGAMVVTEVQVLSGATVQTVHKED